MLRKRTQTRRWTLPGRRSVTSETAALFKRDRRRQIDTVIDYFGGVRGPRTNGGGTAQNGRVLTTDGPFAETKEQI
jgi:hypothetical protein